MPSLDFKNPRRQERGPGTLLAGPGKFIVLIGLIAAGALFIPSDGTVDTDLVDEPIVSSPAELPISAPLLPLPPELRTLTGTIGRGEAFSEALKSAGISHEEVFQLVKTLRKGILRADFNPNIVQRGDRFQARLDTFGVIQSFEYIKRGTLDSRILAEREDGRFRAWKETLPLDRRVVVVSEKIKDSIWNALRATGKNPDVLSSRLIDIFEYEIDFMVDCRPGDRFSIAFEEFYKDDEFVRYGDILAAEYASRGKRVKAFLYEDIHGDRSHYDSDGKSLRGIFLKSPLKYRRISSGYTSRRYHPVLKRYLKHHGIDYAASHGTPIWATAEGTITFIGRQGALGKYIEIKHKNGYKTGYGHMSLFKRGLKKGTYVSQKQVIGFVGATGRATGPHVHYNFFTRSKGEYRLTNPSRIINRPIGKPIPKELIADFFTKRDDLYALFDLESGTTVTAYLDGAETLLTE